MSFGMPVTRPGLTILLSVCVGPGWVLAAAPEPLHFSVREPGAAPSPGLAGSRHHCAREQHRCHSCTGLLWCCMLATRHWPGPHRLSGGPAHWGGHFYSGGAPTGTLLWLLSAMAGLLGVCLPWLLSCHGGLSPRPRPTEVGSRCCQLHRGHDPPQLPVLSHGQGGGPSYPNAGPGGGTLTRGGRRKYTPGPECSGSGVSGEIRPRPRSPHAFLYRALPVGEGGLTSRRIVAPSRVVVLLTPLPAIAKKCFWLFLAYFWPF